MLKVDNYYKYLIYFIKVSHGVLCTLEKHSISLDDQVFGFVFRQKIVILRIIRKYIETSLVGSF